MVNGAMDDYARRWANWLLGNADNVPVIEVTAVGTEFLVQDGGLLALAGADLGATVDEEPWQPGSVRVVTGGQRIRFSRRRHGLRAYLAMPGGIDVPRVLASAATDLTAQIGGMGGRRLEPGDTLRSADSEGLQRATKWPTMRRSHILRVLPGVRIDRFPPGAFAQLLTRVFWVGPESNSVGLRLSGESIASPRGDWPSEGMAIGSVECPPGGQLLLLLKGRGSLGGYPALAHVIQADWPAMGQLAPGDWVAFDAVTGDEAYQAWQSKEMSIGVENIAVMQLTAPLAGIVDVHDEYGRRLPESGDWVYAGQLLLRLYALGSYVEIRAPHDGEMRILVEPGMLVEGNTPLVELKGGFDGKAN
jgi:biotin-dependent carboxylase-like uncharacterized protein